MTLPEETERDETHKYKEDKMIYKNAELYNVEDLIEPEDRVGKILVRIPNNLRITLNEYARAAALCTAGCEIRFKLVGNNAKVVLKSEKSPGAIAEVFQGNFHISSHFVSSDPTKISLSLPQNIEVLDRLSKKENLPFDARVTRVILPYTSIRLMDVDGNIDLPEKSLVPEKRYLAYGSSITHGALAIRPTGTYAMRTAQLLGVDLINLGFGGGAHCEKQMADYIAGRKDWNIATLELGINMMGAFEVKEFRKRVEYFVSKIAESHPDKWIFCVDLFTFYADFDSCSKKQNEFREIVKNTVKNLNMPKLIHIDGREILKSIAGLTTDLCHPSPEGMEEIAVGLSNRIKKKLMHSVL